jgi:hypothetical protein
VRDVRLDQAAIVLEDRLDRLRILWWRRGKDRPKRAGLDRREDRESLDIGEVIGDDVDDLMPRYPEGLDVHIGQPVGLLRIEGGVLRTRVGHAPECSQRGRTPSPGRVAA